MLEKIVLALPESWQPKAKAVALALGTIAGFVVLFWPNAPEWLAIVVGVLTWLGVYRVPNIGYVHPAPEVTAPEHAAIPGTTLPDIPTVPAEPLDAPNEDYEPRHD